MKVFCCGVLSMDHSDEFNNVAITIQSTVLPCDHYEVGTFTNPTTLKRSIWFRITSKNCANVAQNGEKQSMETVKHR